jgi:cytochrome c
MTRRYARHKLLSGTAVLVVALAVADLGRTAEPKLGRSFSPIVDAAGNISFPADFPNGYMHIGTWAVTGVEGVADTHVVYARPDDVEYYRRNGAFSDGTVVIKEVLEAIGSDHTTGKAFWGVQGKTWFVMVKDVKGRFSANPLWGDGWGWAQFDPTDRSKQIAKSYKSDCLGCHIPARAMDWIYVYAYPSLGAKALGFTPEAARTGGLKKSEGHRAEAPTNRSRDAPGSPMSESGPRIDQGKQAFEQGCSACHSTIANMHGIGPSLSGIMGRKAGSAPGYEYSDALQSSKIVWSPDSVGKFLADSRGFIPGNRMARLFPAGVAGAEEREAIVGYLATLK